MVFSPAFEEGMLVLLIVETASRFRASAGRGQEARALIPPLGFLFEIGVSASKQHKGVAYEHVD